MLVLSGIQSRAYTTKVSDTSEQGTESEISYLRLPVLLTVQSPPCVDDATAESPALDVHLSDLRLAPAYSRAHTNRHGSMRRHRSRGEPPRMEESCASFQPFKPQAQPQPGTAHFSCP